MNPEKKKKMLSYVYLIIAFLAIGLVLAYFQSSDLEVTRAAIHFVHPKTSDDALTTPAVVYIWATWCGVCNTNLPIVKMNAGLAQKLGVPFYSLEEGNDPEKLNSYISEKELNFPVGLLNEELINSYRINGYPTTLFINSKGAILFKDTGIINPVSFYIRSLFIKLF